METERPENQPRGHAQPGNFLPENWLSQYWKVLPKLPKEKSNQESYPGVKPLSIQLLSAVTVSVSHRGKHSIVEGSLGQRMLKGKRDNRIYRVLDRGVTGE